MDHRSHLDKDGDGISLTNWELVSLFMQYPNMVDLPDGASANSDSEESLVSDAEASTISDTTAQTTPPRNEPAEVHNSADLGADFPRFLQDIHDGHLSSRSKEFFRSLGYNVLKINRDLFPPGGNVAGSRQRLLGIIRLCEDLIDMLESSIQKVDGHIDNIAYILRRAPFTIRPAPQDLWTNYKQMAELIIEHTTLPSRQEYKLLQQLPILYDAYVYHPLLVLCKTADYATFLKEALGDLYNAIMTLQEEYWRWWKDMKELGDNYTKPTLRRLLNSPTAMQQISEYEAIKDAAEGLSDTPVECTLQASTAESMSAKTSNDEVPRQQETRRRSPFRRQHTV